MSEDVTIDLVGCARCHGEGHEGLTFSPLTFPVEDTGLATGLTHWAACPNNGEPILMGLREVGDERVVLTRAEADFVKRAMVCGVPVDHERAIALLGSGQERDTEAAQP